MGWLQEGTGRSVQVQAPKQERLNSNASCKIFTWEPTLKATTFETKPSVKYKNPDVAKMKKM